MKIEDGVYHEIIKDESLERDDGCKKIESMATDLIESYKKNETVLFWTGTQKALLHVIGANRLVKSSIFKQMLEDLEVSEEVISRAKSICVASIEATTRLSILNRLNNFANTLKPEIAAKGVKIFEKITDEAKNPNSDPKTPSEVVYAEIVQNATQSVPGEVKDDLKSEFVYRRIKLVRDALQSFLLKGA